MALAQEIEAGLFLGFLLLLLGGTTGLAAESKPPWQIEWETTVAAAEKEGLVTVNK
jgi:hypothetical protein